MFADNHGSNLGVTKFLTKAFESPLIQVINEK